MTGFTLLEVLIALIVLSIGALGAVGLQIQAQKFNTGAYFTTQATMITHDMIERARANPSGLSAGNYNAPSATQHSDCYSTVGCSPSDMAENDMYEWAGNSPSSVSKKLPNGTATICIDSSFDDGSPASFACDGLGNVYVVKIWWTNARAEVQKFITTVAFQ